MRWICFICMSIFFFLSAETLLAKIYSWTDANGVKNYSNDPPPAGIAATDSWQEVASVPPALEDVSGQNAAGNVRETPITVMGNGVIVPVTFGYEGRRIYMKLKVDTGAAYTAVYEPATETYDIENFVPLKAYVAGGGVLDAKGLKVEYLRVGPKIQYDAKVVIIKQTGSPVGYDGLLGMSFMRDHRHYIDFERKVLVWLD